MGVDVGQGMAKLMNGVWVHDKSVLKRQIVLQKSPKIPKFNINKRTLNEAFNFSWYDN